MARKRPFSCFKGGRDKVPEMYASTVGWPAYDDSVLDARRRARFNRLKAAVELYLASAPMSTVIAAAGVGERRFSRLFARCGEVTSDGRIVGWTALAAGFETCRRERRVEIVAGAGGRSGFGGAFSKLMAEIPDIGRDLVTYLNATGGRHLRVNRVNFRAIHRRFVAICEEHKIAADQYPLNTRERGRKALRRWIDEVYMPRHANGFIALEHGNDAGKLNSYGEGRGDANAPLGPYSTWIFDEVTVDVNARYEIPSPRGDWEELDLARFIQIRLIDQDSGATLAVRQIFAAQANADDVAILFWDALNGPPDVPKAFEGETVLEGAGYPAVVIPQLRFALPLVIRMDRALSHLANHVQHIATKVLGARVELGPARTPHERAQVESRFAAQARRILHQLPGTTGTGPKDPVRKRAAVPVEGRVRAVEIEYLLDSYARNENATPAAASFNIPPLERLGRQIQAGVLQPRYLAPDKRKPFFFAQPVRVKVLANKVKGQRPYVNYLYMRYTSTQLSKDYTMVGKTLLLRPDLRNLRTVMLFHEDGREHGPVQVMGQWSTFPHDQRIRRLFGRLKRDGQLGERADDRPLEAMFEHLRQRAPADRKAALCLTNLVEFLMRNTVTLGAEMTRNVQDWTQLQSKAEQLAVLPVVSLEAVAAVQPSAEPAAAPRPLLAAAPRALAQPPGVPAPRAGAVAASAAHNWRPRRNLPR